LAETGAPIAAIRSTYSARTTSSYCDIDDIVAPRAAAASRHGVHARARVARGRPSTMSCYVTNNSMWYRAEYVERIAAMGAPVSANQIVSSPRATALYLRDHEPSIRHVLTVGASGMDRELEDAGFRVTARAMSAS